MLEPRARTRLACEPLWCLPWQLGLRARWQDGEGVPVALQRCWEATEPRTRSCPGSVQRCFTGFSCVTPAGRGARRQDEPGSCLEEGMQQTRDAPPSGAASQLLEQRKEGDGYGMGSASSSSHPTSSWELGCWIPTFPALHSSLRLVPLSLQFPVEGRAPFLSWLVTRKAHPLGTSQRHSCKDQG